MSEGKFGCWCYLTVVAKDGEFELERYLDIDFAPAEKMRFVFTVPEEKAEKDDYDYPECTEYFDVERVEYHKDGVFWLHDRRLIGDDGCRCGPADECCVLGNEPAFYLRRGWTMREGPTMLKDRFAEWDWYNPHYKWQFSREQLGFPPAADDAVEVEPIPPA